MARMDVRPTPSPWLLRTSSRTLETGFLQYTQVQKFMSSSLHGKLQCEPCRSSGLAEEERLEGGKRMGTNHLQCT